MVRGRTEVRVLLVATGHKVKRCATAPPDDTVADVQGFVGFQRSVDGVRCETLVYISG